MVAATPIQPSTTPGGGHAVAGLAGLRIWRFAIVPKMSPRMPIGLHTPTIPQTIAAIAMPFVGRGGG